MNQSFGFFRLGGVLGLALALTSCLSDSAPVRPADNLANTRLTALGNNPEPLPFGNTAANITRLKQKPYGGSIRFVILGDNRNSSPVSGGGNKIYQKTLQQINEWQPDFVFNLGDFTFDSFAGHWKTFEKITATIQFPYLTVVGNHDILLGRNYYESRYTPPNPETGLDDYSFDYGNSRFIIMDSANYNFTERQFQWMDKMTQTPLKKFVLTHTPPKYKEWDHKLAPSPEVTARWMALNDKNQVDYVLLGHIHLFDSKLVNKTTYIVSGGAGAPLDKNKPYGQSLHHYVTLEVNGDQVFHKLVPVKTSILSSGPTSYSTGLEANQMGPLLSKYPPDYIPADEQ